MDTHRSTIVGRAPAASEFTILGHAKNLGPGSNSSENTSNHHEITLAHKYFKEIGRFLENADEVHVTGTGTIQEQFMHYLGDTPQFKKTVVTESTSTPMSDDKLTAFISSHFN